MPAYDTNRGYVIIFAIFIISSMYVFLSVVLAVVYDNYRNHMKVCTPPHPAYAVQHIITVVDGATSSCCRTPHTDL